MFSSNIIVRGKVSIPKGFEEVGYGECNSNWIPDTYILLNDITDVHWIDGSSLIVCDEGVYNEYRYSGCDE